MKTLFSILLCCLVISAQSNPGHQKKHKSSLKDHLNLNTERESIKNNNKDSDYGTLYIRNSAKADSIYKYNYFTDEWKSDERELNVKELPGYPEDSFMLNKLETSFYDIENETFQNVLKQFVEYDEEGRLTRVESHNWNGSEWQPEILEVYEFFPNGQEKLYEYYYYSGSEWFLNFGSRSVDTFNADDILTLRVWEIYDAYEYTGWFPTYKQDYFYGENYSDVTITYSYFDYYETEDWLFDNREHFMLNENMEWESGIGYFWNYDTAEWVPEFHYTEIIWNNFEKLQYVFIEAQLNGDLMDDDWKNSSKFDKADINWINFIQIISEYDDLDRLIMSELIFWLEEEINEWVPIYIYSAAFDHLGNLYKSIYEFYLENGDTEIENGFVIDFIYNEDNSISSYLLKYYNKWKEFEPYHGYEYFYIGDATNVIPNIVSNNIYIYPNPAKNFINIATEDLFEDFEITMYNLSGQVIRTTSISLINSVTTIDVSYLQPGCYIIQLKNNSRTINKRFIKN
jgi:hypothetical protein